MADTTLGQRIAEQRKALRLSREELGGLLEVTGHTVAKWETDAIIPDAANLSALSQLFEVSIGWLLGMEQAPQKEAASQKVNRQLSETQLEQVEDLIRRYCEQFPPRTGSSGSRFSLLLAAIALVAALFALAHTRSQLTGYTRELDSLSKDNAALHLQLSELADKVALLEELTQGTQLLSSYTIQASADGQGTGAIIAFDGIPARVRPDDRASLEVWLEGEKVLSQPCDHTDSTFTATVTLPAANGYSYRFLLLHPDGTAEQQLLAEEASVDAYAIDISRGLQPDVSAELQWETKGSSIRFKACDLFLLPPGLTAQGNVLWIDAQLQVFLNDALQEKVSLQKYLSYLADTDGSNFLAGTVYPDIRQISLKAGDYLELRLLAALNDGTSVEVPVLRLICEKPGSITEVPLPD